MAQLNNETEYMYCTARVRSLENKIPSKDIQNRLIDAVSNNEITMILRDIGIQNPNGDYEEELQKLLEYYYDEIEKTSPQKYVVEIFRYRFDCNNIKVAIKCAFRGTDAIPMLYDAGTVAKKDVIDAVQKNDFGVLPANMALASKKASELLAKTKNPSTVDVLIDNACYKDMVENCDSDTVKSWLKLRIDLTNIVIAIRIIRMNLGEVALPTFEDAFISMGNLDKKEIAAHLLKGEDDLLESLKYGEMSKFVEEIKNLGKDSTLSKIEKVADDFYMEKIRETRFVPFGAEIPAGFIEGIEYALKNIRIILASKNASLSSDMIRGRLRLNYV